MHLFTRKKRQNFFKSCVREKAISSVLTAQNIEVSPNFLLFKFCGSTDFLQSIGWITQKSAEIVRFHKISTYQEIEWNYGILCSGYDVTLLHWLFISNKFQIWDALRDLVPFIQIKNREKHPWRSATFSKIAGSSVLHAQALAQFSFPNIKKIDR